MGFLEVLFLCCCCSKVLCLGLEEPCVSDDTNCSHTVQESMCNKGRCNDTHFEEDGKCFLKPGRAFHLGSWGAGGTTSISVSWTFNRINPNSTLIHWKAIENGHDPKPGHAEVLWPTRRFTIQHLIPGVRYEINIWGKTGKCLGEPDTRTRRTIPAEVSPYVEHETSKSMTISWNQIGVVTGGYMCNVYPPATVIRGTSETTIYLTNLLPATRYTVKLQGISNGYYGPLSSSVFSTLASSDSEHPDAIGPKIECPGMTAAVVVLSCVLVVLILGVVCFFLLAIHKERKGSMHKSAGETNHGIAIEQDESLPRQPLDEPENAPVTEGVKRKNNMLNPPMRTEDYEKLNRNRNSTDSNRVSDIYESLN